MDLRITIVSRSSYTVQKVFNCYDWSIARDTIASVQSKFSFAGNETGYDIAVGDFVIAKSIGEWIYPTQPHELAASWTKALYIGVVEAVENSEVSASEMNSLYNISIPITSSWNGANPSNFIESISTDVLTADRYLDDVTYLVTDTSYQNFHIQQDKIASYNVETVLSNLFKTTQFMTTCLGYKYDPVNGKLIFAMSSYKNLTDFGNLLLSHNSKVMNASIYIRPENVGNPNALLLQYNKYRYTYYLTEKGAIVTNSDTTVHLPVSKMGYVYTSPETLQEGEREPSPTDIAMRELKIQKYQHEITFDIKSDYSQLYRLLNIGSTITLQYSGHRYPSIITKWEANSKSDFFTITCGNVRSTLQFALDGTYE